MLTATRPTQSYETIPVPPGNQVPFGPLPEAGSLSAGLDYYKPTMSQVWYEQEPDAELTFTFKNRGEQRLADYVNPADLQSRFDRLRERGFTENELDYFSSLKLSTGEPVFNADYLDYLRDRTLPPVSVMPDPERNDVAIEVTGPAALATFWETIVMSEVNEAYFEGYLLAHDLDPFEVYAEGERRLDEKIALLQANPDVKIAEFGTRRHFSLRWQKHVMQRLQNECPNNLVGTSNVALANTFGVAPIGTFAHEMMMGYAGLADARGEDIRASHNRFLQTWEERYGKDLSIALTDTFTTDFFFEDFTTEQAESWRGVRHDSGDPVAFGERLIGFYEANGIDPKTKTVIFSDGLDIGQIMLLQKHFAGRINTVYGWGTTLTNDLGLKPLNVVMKATHVRLPDGREADTVKLSDNPGKHTGPADLVECYRSEIFDTES